MKFDLLPCHIYQDDFILSNSNKILKENNIEGFIDKEIEDFVKKAYDNKKEQIINREYNFRLNLLTKKFIKDFISSTYLIDSKEDIDVEDINKKAFNQFSMVANNILRNVKKDRKNDYNDVLNSIKTQLKSGVEPKALSEEDAISLNLDDEMLSPMEIKNKLEKYIDNTCFNIREKAKLSVIPIVKQEMNEYLKDNEDSIEETLNIFIKEFRVKNVKEFKEDLEANLSNLYNKLLRIYTHKINFIEKGNQIILVNPNSLTIDDKVINFTSGKLKNNKVSLSLSDKDYFIRYGETLTLVLGE